MRDRRLSAVPLPVLVLLVAGLTAQVLWHHTRPAPEARAEALPSPPALDSLRLAALGDPWVLAKCLMLWLQAFDNQPGISIPFKQLDYHRVKGWLTRILELDPRGQYPLLAAGRLYAAIPDQTRKRLMLDFIYEQFRVDPDRRWPWLAHAAIVAKHQLEDLPLALEYARAITELATGPGVPNWARDMTVVVLEDMGELESARLLIGGLLDSGRVTDPHEIRFLSQKLRELEQRLRTPPQESSE